MAETLLFGEREARILAATEIGQLNSKQRRVLAENGVIPPLVLMLHSDDCEFIEAALFALLNLAFGTERNKLRIVKAGAIPAILKILKRPYNSLLELALAFLLILSSCSANKPEIGRSGGVQLLFELLQSFSECISNQAKFDIIATLHNLSTCHQTIPSFLLSGGLITLVQLIYDCEKSSYFVEKAMALLESIVSYSEVALTQVCEVGGVIPMLVEAVEEGSAACQEHATGVLLSICQSCRERYRGLILKEGAMPGLLQLSINGSWQGREKAEALLILLRDCNNGRSSSTKHSKNVALEEVMRQIDGGESIGINSVQMVEEMIARLRT